LWVIFAQPGLGFLCKSVTGLQPQRLIFKEVGFTKIAQGNRNDISQEPQFGYQKGFFAGTATVDTFQNSYLYSAEWLIALVLLLYAAKFFFRGFKGGLKLSYLRARNLKLRFQLFISNLKGRYLLFRLNRTLAALKRIRKVTPLRENSSNGCVVRSGGTAQGVPEFVNSALESGGRHDGACKTPKNPKQ
jgi:hypothetical protein